MSYRIILFVSILLLFSCKKETPIIIPTDTSEGSITLINEEFEGESIIVIGSQKSNFIVAFEKTTTDGTLLNFEVKQRKLPIILEDNEGNLWDIEGKAVEGPRTGQQLTPINSYIGFWFAWATMYPEIELFDGPTAAENIQMNPPADNWSISTQNVFSVLSQDAIPAVDEPKFETYLEKDFIEAGSYFIEDNDLVVIVTIGGITKVYPHAILNWHEIVNDNIGDFYYSVSFCPITGTAVMWDRKINDKITTFGVSGLLYSGNVIPYDRQTTSLWSQMKQECVNGTLINNKMDIFPVVETTWATAKLIRKEPLVMTTETGFGKDYMVNPYESYITNHDWISYPLEFEDNRIPNKERVFGIMINGKAKAYQFKDF